MKKIKKLLSFALALTLCALVGVFAFADTGFNAGLDIEYDEGLIRVTVQDSSVLHDKQPTLSIVCSDESYSDAMVFFDGTAAAATYEDGYLSFKVAKGGTYTIAAEGWTLSETVDPTCTEDGENIYTFNGSSYSEPIAATGHDFGDGEEKCGICGEPNPDYEKPPAPPAPDTPSYPAGSTTTVKKEDGSVVTTEVKSNGTVVETVTTAEGVKTITTVSPSGAVKATAEIPAKVAKGGKIVSVPVSGVVAAKNSKAAAVITVTTNNSAQTNVEIPVMGATTGTVVVMVNANGAETVLSDTRLTARGVAAKLPNGAIIKVVDNSKDFIDIAPGSWYEAAIDYVSARGIVNGVTYNSYGHEGIATRAQLWTMLARMDGVNVSSSGGQWYAAAQQWAIENNVSDGTDPNGELTREQLVTMLWRYMGSPASKHSITHFADHHSTSDWAYGAIQWANENGIINGMNGLLNPQGKTTRAQLAQFIMNFMENL